MSSGRCCRGGELIAATAILVCASLPTEAQTGYVQSIPAIEAALDREPLSPRILESLGEAHAKAGHELAALAWLHAAAAADPGPTASAVADRVTVLHGVVNGKLKRIYEEAGRIRGALAAGQLPSGALRDYVRLAVITEIALGERLAAQTAMEAIAAEPEQADIWAQIARSFMTTYADLETAEFAAERIADPVQRESIAASITAARAARTNASGGSPVLNWIELAKQLSKQPHVIALHGELQRAVDAPIAEVPLRLLDVGAALAIDYMKVWRLERGRSPY